MRRGIFLIAISLFAMAACSAVGPDYQRVDPPVPDRFGSIEPGITEPDPLSSIDWWGFFEDPLLNRLIDKAVRNNHDVRVAAARVRQARAMRGVASARFYPEGEGTLSYQRYRTSENSYSSAGGDQGTLPFGGAGSEDDLYEMGFDASWEIDIFGGLRREVEAADAEFGASIETLGDTLLTVQAEVARNYIELRAAQLRLAIAQNDVRSRQENVSITASRVRAGFVNELDLSRSQGALANAQASIPLLEESLYTAMHRLGVLTGDAPVACLPELINPAPIPCVPQKLPTGVPADLIRRRPDIRRAERELAAATARIGISTAELYPRFSLTGSIGLQSNDNDTLLESGSDFWRAGPAVKWDILNLARILSSIEADKAIREGHLAAYEQSVLHALEEVENALVALSREKQRIVFLVQAVDANELAVSLALTRYQAGLESYLTYLDAQTALRLSQDQLALSRQNASLGLIALYKSLGGGWPAPMDGGTENPGSHEIRSVSTQGKTHDHSNR